MRKAAVSLVFAIVLAPALLVEPAHADGGAGTPDTTSLPPRCC